MQAAGITAFVPVLQAFEDFPSGYGVPSPEQIHRQFAEWDLGGGLARGYFVFRWDYGTRPLDSEPSVVAALKAENDKR